MHQLSHSYAYTLCEQYGTEQHFMLSRVALKTAGGRLLTTSATAMSFYSLTGVKGDGEAISTKDFKGKVVCATNVSSR